MAAIGTTANGNAAAAAAPADGSYTITFALQAPLGLSLVPAWPRPSPDAEDELAELAAIRATVFPRIVVSQVLPDSQAAKDGRVRLGDQLVGFEGKAVEDFGTYDQLLARLRGAGRPMTLRFRPRAAAGAPGAASAADAAGSTPRALQRDAASSSSASSGVDRLAAREDALETALARPVVVLEELRSFSKFGLPERRRPLVWRLLLGYLPPEREEWEAVQARQRQVYADLVRELDSARAGGSASSRPARLEGQAWFEQGLTAPRAPSRAPKAPPPAGPNSGSRRDGDGDAAPADPAPRGPGDAGKQEKQEREEEAEQGGGRGGGEEEDSGDPLSNPGPPTRRPGRTPAAPGDAVDELEPSSPDTALDEDIWKDVQRTHPGLHFFTQQTYERMRRILFVYAKMNPGLKYIQGMNEVLAPIVYVLGTEKPPVADADGWEADAFFLFSSLMADVRDLFIRNLDSSRVGLKGQLTELSEMLARHDARLAQHLSELDVQFQFFAIRWLTTLLTREFDLPDAVRVWDSLLADGRRLRFAQCVCVSLLMHQRAQLLGADFAGCVKTLQGQVPHTLSVERVLEGAERVARWEDRPPPARAAPQPYSPSLGAAFVNGAPAAARTFLHDVRAAAESAARTAERAARTLAEEFRT